MTKNNLHPGAKWLFRVGIFFTVVFLSIFLSFWFVPLFTIVFSDSNDFSFSFIFFTWITLVIVFMILGEIWVRMAYNRWFYEFTDTNLKVEKGVIWKKYSNVPYERVQNVDIQRGIIARMLGFSSVNIQTAGYSVHAGGRGGVGSEGYIPAVDVNSAEQIRDFLMKKISKKHSGSGGL